jgi:hypothetical protein
MGESRSIVVVVASKPRPITRQNGCLQRSTLYFLALWVYERFYDVLYKIFRMLSSKSVSPQSPSLTIPVSLLDRAFRQHTQ